jgi:hypothetical protein
MKASMLFSEENTSGVVIWVAGLVSKKLSLHDDKASKGIITVIYFSVIFMINQICWLKGNVEN